MPADPLPAPRRRADAERNRAKIVAAARAAFAEAGADVSMAEISRRAEVGMATLYRNFPGRRELLEALYVEEVDAICAAAGAAGEVDAAGDALIAWLRRFVEFVASKHEIANELLQQTDDRTVFDDSRSRVLAAGRQLLVAAQADGDVRDDLTLEQLLDLVIAISSISDDPAYLEPILQAALDGIRRPAG